MDEDRFNHSLRSFLKQVGVTSQRELEKAARAAADKGALPAGGLPVTMTLRCEALGVEHVVEAKLDTD
ncbi:DUF6494 family protein [Algiphilus aromaticivorans]|uniref:DUF6494 family protein n=1 Tax=Algiphilus aromaticivorans TaxID=382454 RepID=UPI0005C1925C|nr:DUF6494 family protein [Algiphilus aromaticivorans]